MLILKWHLWWNIMCSFPFLKSLLFPIQILELSRSIPPPHPGLQHINSHDQLTPLSAFPM